MGDANDGDSAYFYFSSLFTRCDPRDTGLVKVSVLLQAIRELQALAKDSNEDGVDGENGSLKELKEELDPQNEDPMITLNKFTEGVTSYLKMDKYKNDFYANEKQEEQAEGQLEVESTDMFQIDVLHTEIGDLRLQINKMTEDNTRLKNHLTAVQEENCTILHALDSKVLELKSQAERVKRLEREMDDKADIICTLEGRNAALCNKVSQIGAELTTLHKERKRLLSENVHLKEIGEKSKSLLASKEDLVRKMKSDTSLAEMQWRSREKSLSDSINSLNISIEELNQSIIELEIENSKLKQRNQEKMVLETAKSFAEELAATDGTILQHLPCQSITSSSSPPVVFPGENYDEIFIFTPSDNIETEMVDAGENHQLPVIRCTVERFDAATQCNCGGDDDDKLLSTEIYLDHGANLTLSKCDENLSENEAQDFMEKKSFKMTNSLNSTEKWLNKVIIFVIIVIVIGFILLVPFDDGCITNPAMFMNVESYFKYCGKLTHDEVPII